MNAINPFYPIGFRLSGFRRVPLEKAIGAIARMGYDSLEICLEHPELDPDSGQCWSSEQLQECLDQYRMTSSSVSFHGKHTAWGEKFAKCCHGIELAQILGNCPFITGSSVDSSPDSFENMRLFTRSLCEKGEESGIDIAVEPEPGTLINGSAEMRSLIQSVQMGNLKINLDIGHALLTEKDLREDILKWNDRIVQLHIEDIKGNQHIHLIPGQGEINFKDVFRSLQEIDYHGHVIMDLFDIQDNPVEHAQNALRVFRRIMS